MASWSFAQEKGALIIQITDVESDGKGAFTVMLFNKKDGFPREKEHAAYVGKIDKLPANGQFKFQDIPFGRYAVSIHRDTNGNGKMDSNLIGFPKEPIGASNMEKMRRPSFKKSSFDFKTSGKIISVKLMNQ